MASEDACRSNQTCGKVQLELLQPGKAKPTMTVLTAQLERLLCNAKRIKTPEFQEVVHDYRDMFAKHAFRLRPSVGSISLVSCASSTPQLGFSGITSAATLRTKLAALREGKPFEEAGRSTPEKSLQSWLISQAMQNGGQLHPIEHALNDQYSYWFVTDEIALTASKEKSPTGKSVRVVADLLIVRFNSIDEGELINVELKSERTTKTHGQIKAFWDFMKSNEVALWRELVDTMLGGDKRRWKNTDRSNGIVIWPRPAGAAAPATATLMTNYRLQGIETICYSGPPYSFEPERYA